MKEWVTLIADGIDVVRILHERMDFQRHIP
jgi:plasmid stabilization system protein ParE